MSSEIRTPVTPAADITPQDLQMAEGMVKDGIELPPDLKTAYDAHKAKSATPPVSQDGTPPKEPDKKPDTPPVTPVVEPGATKGADGNDGKGGEGKDKPGEGSAVEPPEPRAIKTVPLAKFLETETKLKESEKIRKDLEGRLSNLPNESAADYDKKVEALAEKLGLDVSVVKELDAFFAERHKLPPEVLASIEQAQRINKEDAFWEKEYGRFDEEFSVDLEDLRKTNPTEAAEMEKHRGEIKDLAFTQGYNKRSTWEIWQRFVKPNLEPSRKTVEVPGSAAAPGGGRDWSKIAGDPVAIRGLSAKEFEELDAWLTAHSGGVILRPAKRL